MRLARMASSLSLPSRATRDAMRPNCFKAFFYSCKFFYLHARSVREAFACGCEVIESWEEPLYLDETRLLQLLSVYIERKILSPGKNVFCPFCLAEPRFMKRLAGDFRRDLAVAKKTFSGVCCSSIAPSSSYSFYADGCIFA